MHYRVLLFDADGMTLIPKRFSEQIEQEYGIPWERMKSFFTGPYQQCKLGIADLREELIKVMEYWGWHGTVDELIAYWFSIGSEVRPEIREIIQELRAKGIYCDLATNQEKYREAYLDKARGFETLFDRIFASSEIGYLKQDVPFFQDVYRKLRVEIHDLQKEEVLFIDHEELNLEAARTFGFATYYFRDLPCFRSEIVAGILARPK